MSKKINTLPIKDPIPTSSSHQAAVFSILQGCEEGRGWLINNYIQIFSLKSLFKANEARKGTIDYYYSEYGDWSLFEFSSNPILGYSLIDFETFQLLNKTYLVDLIAVLKRAIDNRKYIYIGIDKYYISYYEEFGTEHCAHHLFINA